MFKIKEVNISILKKNPHIFFSYFTEVLLVQITQLILTVFSFKYLSNELFYSLGLIQIIQSFGIVYYDSGIYTIVKSADYKIPRLRDTLLSVSFYRFVLFFLLLILVSVVNFFFNIYPLNNYFYIFILYILVCFFTGFYTTILESSGLLSKITYARSFITSCISIVAAIFIYYFKSDEIYIAQLFFTQIALLAYMFYYINPDFEIRRFKPVSLFLINKKVKFTRNNILMGFMVENFFLMVNYLTSTSTSNAAKFYKLDKYLKVFFGFILGFYQRTFFYIQLQQRLPVSIKKSFVIFLLIVILGLVPVYLILSKLHSFDVELFIKLAFFYLLIYSIVFLNYINTLKKSNRLMIFLNFLLVLILFMYFIISVL
jgi:hypothetical protein